MGVGVDLLCSVAIDIVLNPDCPACCTACSMGYLKGVLWKGYGYVSAAVLC